MTLGAGNQEELVDRVSELLRARGYAARQARAEAREAVAGAVTGQAGEHYDLVGQAALEQLTEQLSDRVLTRVMAVLAETFSTVSAELDRRAEP